jgi:hypothetical protein
LSEAILVYLYYSIRSLIFYKYTEVFSGYQFEGASYSK